MLKYGCIYLESRQPTASRLCTLKASRLHQVPPLTLARCIFILHSPATRLLNTAEIKRQKDIQLRIVGLVALSVGNLSIAPPFNPKQHIEACRVAYTDGSNDVYFGMNFASYVRFRQRKVGRLSERQTFAQCRFKVGPWLESGKGVPSRNKIVERDAK